MQGRKEQSEQAYHAKIEHKKNDKEKKNKNPNLEELENIRQFSQEKLLEFLQSKYDKILQKDEELFIKLNRAILERIKSFKTQFYKQKQQEMKDFIKKGYADLTDQQYLDGVHWKSNDIYGCNKSIDGINYLLISIFKTKQHRQNKLFFSQSMDEADFDLKRLKKQSIAYLEKFIERKNKIQGQLGKKY